MRVPHPGPWTVLRRKYCVPLADRRFLTLFAQVEIARPHSKESYPSDMKVAYRIRDTGLALPHEVTKSLGFNGISRFPMQGCNDGLEGDVVMLMPAFNVTERDIEKIVEAFAAAVETLLGPDGSLVANELSG